MSKDGKKALADYLALSNEEIQSNWSKFAALIRLYEGVVWEVASEKARALLKEDKSEEFLEAIRAGVDPKEVAHLGKSSMDKGEGAPILASNRKSKYQRNYEKILQFAPGIEERLLNGEFIYGKSIITGYDDLNLELIHKDSTGYYLAMSHYFKKNGDLVADPDMVLLFDIQNKAVQALSFQNQFYYRTVYDDIYNRKLISLKEKKDQNAFLTQWLNNILAQGHLLHWREESEESEPANLGESDNVTDISFFEDDVVSEIAEYFDKMILDSVLQFYLKHKEGKMTFGAVALFYIARRINQSPSGLHVEYPSNEAIRQDYDRIKAIKDLDQKITLDLNPEEQKSEEMSEVEQTAKYWMKLASVIRETEGISQEEANQKALQLKKDNKAEAYLVKAFKKRTKSNIGNITKLNYQALLRLYPKLLSEIAHESFNLEISLNNVADPEYAVKKAADKSESIYQLAIYDQRKEKAGTVILAIQPTAKKMWVELHSDGFLDAPDYLADSTDNSPSDNYAINEKFGAWLDYVIEHRTYTKSQWSWSDLHKDTRSKEPESTLNAALEKFPIVMEWSEGSDKENVGFNNLEELESELKTYRIPGRKSGYTKNKIWFRGFPSYVRIDMSESDGDFDPRKQNLLDFMQEYEPAFDWAQYAKKQKKSVASETSEEKSEVVDEFELIFDKEKLKEDALKMPDFEPGKVELTPIHVRAGITQADIDWINKHKQGLVITPRRKKMISNTKDIEKDIQHQAQLPGRRISRTGKIYYEGRSNRSDRTKYGF